MERALTDFEKRIASALKNADMLNRSLKRERLTDMFVTSIHMGPAAYAQAKSLVIEGRITAYGPEHIFGFPVVVDHGVMPSQITVQASMRIP